MQPITEIVNEIDFPIWMCWGIALYIFTIAAIDAAYRKGSEETPWFKKLPVKGLIPMIITMSLIFYFANDSVTRKKEFSQEMEVWKQELVNIKTSSMEKRMNEISQLDECLQSIEGIIGYLDQSIKMGHEPKKLVPIVLFLAKEIKEIRDTKQ